MSPGTGPHTDHGPRPADNTAGPETTSPDTTDPDTTSPATSSPGTEEHVVRGSRVASRWSRRRLFGAAAGAGALVGTGALGGYLAADQTAGPAGGDAASAVIPFRGLRQAGIITPAQDRLHFVAFDVMTSGPTLRRTLSELLRRWTLAAERMTAGAEAAPGGAVNRNPEAPPSDTGEALGLPATGLTLTFGIGPSLLDKLGVPRPPALAALPGFQGDNLDPALSGGDLCVQACANDPQVAVHAVRNLARMGFGTTAVRWSQLGFGRTSSTSSTQQTQRNLFGFKDGTHNLKAEDTPELDQQVWVPPGDGPAWLTGGTYLVARRIRMRIEVWDRTSRAEQESLIGRTKGEGAPVGAAGEFDPIDLGARGPDGQPAIAADAHIRLASAESLGGVRILRRGYSFVDGSDGAGHLNAGLFFIAFMRDPQRQFVPMQTALARSDRMMQYIEHTSSAVFACPAGLGEGAYWGQPLLET